MDTYIEYNSWNIYHGIKGFVLFLSIVSFLFVHKFYHYRERDEIVNEQAIIEEQYEGELEMKKTVKMRMNHLNYLLLAKRLSDTRI